MTSFLRSLGHSHFGTSPFCLTRTARYAIIGTAPHAKQGNKECCHAIDVALAEALTPLCLRLPRAACPRSGTWQKTPRPGDPTMHRHSLSQSYAAANAGGSAGIVASAHLSEHILRTEIERRGCTSIGRALALVTTRSSAPLTSLVRLRHDPASPAATHFDGRIRPS